MPARSLATGIRRKLMGSFSSLDTFISTVFFSFQFNSHLAVFLLGLFLIAGLRIALMFREHPSWITFCIRMGFGVIPIAVCVLLTLHLISKTWGAIEWNWVTHSHTVSGFVGIFTGIATAYLLGRFFEPKIINYLHQKTLSSGLQDHLTDIRTVEQSFYGRPDADVEKEIEGAITKDQIYLGQDTAGNAVSINREKWKTSHVQIMGPPGAGKGVQAGVTLTQSLLYGDAVFVFDPKEDEWAPSVYKAACERAKVPFEFVDLRQSAPQINPILKASTNEVEEMLYAGLELGRRGNAADYYRLDDRKAARIAASFVADYTMTLSEIGSKARSSASEELMAGGKAFFAALDEISSLECTQTKEGVDLSVRIEEGGCTYFVGSVRNEPIITLQKMLFVRLIQLIERSRERKRHCSIFLDEFKYLLSLPALNALGTIRDKGCNILLAHQSLGDFASCGADLREQSVRATVLDTTPVKWLYRPADYATATWISNQTGEILVSTQNMQAERNIELSESLSSSRSVGETTRNLIDVNTVLSLPKACAVCIGAGLPKLAFAEAMRVAKTTTEITVAELAVDLGVDLLTQVTDNTDEFEQPGNMPAIDWGGDPGEAILHYLFGEMWTHVDIISEMLAGLSEEQLSQVLNELSKAKMIRSVEISFIESSSAQIWGITAYGINSVREKIPDAENRRAFSKNSVNPVSFTHQLDIQRLRISAERSGWYDWTKCSGTERFSKKRGIIPDVVATRPDGVRIAIEVERTVKSKSRYPRIMGSHLHARKFGQWDEIIYLCPDARIKRRLENIYSEIEEVDYFGDSVKITDQHRQHFRFYSYDENWTGVQ